MGYYPRTKFDHEKKRDGDLDQDRCRDRPVEMKPLDSRDFHLHRSSIGQVAFPLVFQLAGDEDLGVWSPCRPY